MESDCIQNYFVTLQKTSSLPTPLGGNRISLGGGGGGMKLGSAPIKPTISMVTTKTGNTQTVTLVQKPATTITSGPAQKIVSVNRPVFKVTPGTPGMDLVTRMDQVYVFVLCCVSQCMFEYLYSTACCEIIHVFWLCIVRNYSFKWHKALKKKKRTFQNIRDQELVRFKKNVTL